MKAKLSTILFLSSVCCLATSTASAQASIAYGPGTPATTQGLWQFHSAVPGYFQGVAYKYYGMGAVSVPVAGGFALNHTMGFNPDYLVGTDADGYVQGFDYSASFHGALFGSFQSLFSGNAHTLKLDLAKGEMRHSHSATLTTGEEPPNRHFKIKTWQDNGRGLVYVAPFTVVGTGAVSVNAFDLSRTEGPLGPVVDGYTKLSWRLDFDANGDGIFDGIQSTPILSGALTVVNNQSKSGAPVPATQIAPGTYTLRLVYDSGSKFETFYSLPGPNSSVTVASIATMSDAATFELTIQ